MATVEVLKNSYWVHDGKYPQPAMVKLTRGTRKDMIPEVMLEQLCDEHFMEIDI